MCLLDKAPRAFCLRGADRNIYVWHLRQEFQQMFPPCVTLSLILLPSFSFCLSSSFSFVTSQLSKQFPHLLLPPSLRHTLLNLFEHCLSSCSFVLPVFSPSPSPGVVLLTVPSLHNQLFVRMSLHRSPLSPSPSFFPFFSEQTLKDIA